MKQLQVLIFSICLVTFSCEDQSVVQLESNEDKANDKSEEKIINDSLVIGDEVYASLQFSIDDNSGLETNTDILFENQSENLSDFEWDFGDGTISKELNPEHRYASSGKYIVTLRNVSSTGLETSYTKELFVRNQGSELDLLFITYQDSSLNYVDLSTQTVKKLYNVPYNPAGVLALDEENQKVYYYDYSQHLLIENELTLNRPRILLENLHGVSDIEFDQVNKKLFIALSYDDAIIVYNPSDQDIVNIYSSASKGRFGKVRDMDFKDDALFTITPTQSYESVFKVDAIEGFVDQLIDYQAGGYGYGVAFDDLNDNIYFNNVEEAALMRADADGSNIQKLMDLDRNGSVSFGSLCLVGLEVVEARNQLIWSAWDDEHLHIFNIGTQTEQVIEIDGLFGKFVPFENNGFAQN